MSGGGGFVISTPHHHTGLRGALPLWLLQDIAEAAFLAFNRCPQAEGYPKEISDVWFN